MEGSRFEENKFTCPPQLPTNHFPRSTKQGQSSATTWSKLTCTNPNLVKTTPGFYSFSQNQDKLSVVPGALAKVHTAELGPRPKLLQNSGLCPPWLRASRSTMLSHRTCAIQGWSLVTSWSVLLCSWPAPRSGREHYIFKSATASSVVSQLAGAGMGSAQQDAVCLAGSLNNVFYYSNSPRCTSNLLFFQIE